MHAPVVLFVYNRWEHTRKVLSALECNEEAAETKLYIFSDAPSSENEEENVKNVRENIRLFKDNSSFLEVEIREAEKNMGLEKSIINGITEIITKHGKVIVLEDDIVVTPDFLKFMNLALLHYQHDKKIWSISGYNLNSKRISKGKRDVYIGRRASCWGWASWEDRWNTVDWEVEDFEEFVKDKSRQKDFNKGGRDLSDMLIKQQKGEIKSWAIRWCYQQYKENMVTIFPRNSKIINIGLDGSGTNCGSLHKEEVQLIAEEQWDFQYDLNDFLVQREFLNFYWKGYWRQKLGYYWYLLTEYEYCLAFFDGQAEPKCKYKYLKPNYREYYTSPMIFKWKEKKYVFMEIYEKRKRKGCIGVAELNMRGDLTRPQKVLLEKFHMSFPCVFEYKDSVYMVPDCSAIGEIRIYRMDMDVNKWNLWRRFENVGKIVNLLYCPNDANELWLLGAEINSANSNMSRQICFKVENLDNEDKSKLEVLWKEESFSYAARNGGNFCEMQEGKFRVAQNSTKEVLGKSVFLNHVNLLNNRTLDEKPKYKIDINNCSIELPAYIYRMQGVHGYGRNEQFEIVDILVQRFSLMGIWEKLKRRIINVRNK